MRKPRYEDVQPVRPLVSEKEAWEAKVWQDETDKEWGQIAAAFTRASYRIRMAEAAGVMVSQETSDAKRQADSRCSAQYAKAVEELYQAELLFRQWEARRAAKQNVIDLFRTLRADQRARDVLEGPARR